MSLQLDDVVSFHDEPIEESPPPVRSGVEPLVATRRQFLGAATAVGMGAALGLIGSIPLPRVASAACVSALHTDMDGACSSRNDGFGCNPACGSSMVYNNACDGTWHKYTGNWRNRPNDCSSTMASADGWFWLRCCSGQCGGKASKYKCHDGCHLVNGVWKNSVCRTLTCVNPLC
jgi:hypothetical protein